jgi:hypothetical protein
MKKQRKKIAFDLDDTLIPTTTSFAVGSQKCPFPLNLFFKEELRIGTIELMKELSQEYDLWIYTTSLRSEFYLKSWFYSLGINIDDIVNYQIHNKSLKGTKYAHFTKAPKAFGISLLIDDSMGVKIECEKQGVEVLILDAKDKDWVFKVKEAVELISVI